MHFTNTKNTKHKQLNVSILSMLSGILERFIFLERWIGSLQVQPCCEIGYNFIFGMLCNCVPKDKRKIEEYFCVMQDGRQHALHSSMCFCIVYVFKSSKS